MVATSSNRSIVLEGVAAAAEALVGKSNKSSRKGSGVPFLQDKFGLRMTKKGSQFATLTCHSGAFNKVSF